MDGKTALVTGAAGDIGRAVCRCLIARGAHVVGIDTVPWTSPPGADAGIELVIGDIRDRDTVRTAMARAEELAGPVSLLVNNAGVIDRGPLRDMEPPDLETVLTTNIIGTFGVTQEVCEHLVKRSDAAVVTVSSIAARTGGEHIAAYAASKAAIETLTRILALELAPLGVRANSVAPGVIETQMTVGTNAPAADELQAVHDRIPLARMGQPADVAEAITFLLSPAAGYITGTTVVVDGGLSIT